jgi:chromosome partitioning protein
MSQDGDNRRLAMVSTGLGWANAATATGRASSWAKPQQSHPAGLGWPVPGGDGASSSPAVSRETAPGAEQVMTDEANPTAPLGPVSRETRGGEGGRVIAVANQKGGVGKTTSVVNLAAGLALSGSAVLLVDLDPQGNASTAMGVDHRSGVPSTYEALIDGVPIRTVIRPAASVPGLDCVPATIDLAGAEIELVSVVARESRLRRALTSVRDDYDYIFLDCPPSLGLLTVNALVAADEIVIPIQCEYYALEGLGQLLSNIDLIRTHLNADLRISAVLLTMFDARTRLSEQVAEEVRAHFGDVVLRSVVPRSVRISEAPSYGQSVVTYDPGSRGAGIYRAAAVELAARGRAEGG